MVSVGSVTVDVVPDARNFDRDLSTKLNPAAVRAGQDYGRRFAEGLRAELAGANNPDVNIGVDTGRASAEVDAFLLETKAKSAAASADMGDANGSMLATGMRQSFLRKSPLIAAAVAGGLLAGAPLAAAGATALFAGVAAVAVHSQQQVHQAAIGLGNDVMNTLRSAAAVTVPFFVQAMQQLDRAIIGIGPDLQDVFSSLKEPIRDVTGGFVALIQNAMPGLVALVRSAGPVFQGLATMLADIGTGLGHMFDAISQHGAAGGTVLEALGKAIQALLDALGPLIGAGAELGAQILPGIASALGTVAQVLKAIAPVLPEIVAGFLAFRGISALAGPIGSLAEKLAGMGSAGSAAAGALSSIGGALPIIGIAVGLVAAGFEQSQKKISDWAHALLDGGAAAEQAARQMDVVSAQAQTLDSGITGLIGNLTGYGAALSIGANASKNTRDKAKELYDALSPLQQKQQDVTKATNDLQLATEKYGADSGQAAGASVDLKDKQQALADLQAQLSAATNGTSISVEQNSQRLAELSTTASAASTQINILKGALDALTGKAVTMDQAEIAVTQAVEAATTATKGQTGALVDATGQINLHSAAGAAAAQALINLASVQHNEIATLEQQGATTDQVSAKTDALRQQFIQQAIQMGFTAVQAQNLANRYFGIPGDVHTEVTADTAQANAALDVVQAKIAQLMQDHVAHLSLIAPTSVGGLGVRGVAATGGVLPGYAPGVDSVPMMLSPGEGVLVPEAVRGLGGAAAIHALNSRFSGRVPGMANGGVVDLVTTMDNSGILASIGQAMSVINSWVSASTFTGGGGGAGSPFIRILGQAIAASMGFGGQFNAIDYIFSHESGWNPLAQNPTSTAFGIPQFLNSTWAAYGGKTTDPGAQIRDGISYMRDRYGSPNNAAAFWQGHHWYGQGTNYVPSDQLAVLHKGEAVVPADQNQGAPYRSGPAVFNLYDVDGVLIGSMRGAAARRAGTRQALAAAGVRAP